MAYTTDAYYMGTTTGTCINYPVVVDYNNAIWQNWIGNSSNTLSTDTYTTTAWTQWNTQWIPYNQEYQQRLTPEQLEELEAQRIRMEEARQLRIQEEEQRSREFNETEERAKACLLSNIDDDQAEEFKNTSSFTLKTDKRTYRIHLRKMVEELDAGNNVIARYCIYTREGVPSHDDMLNKVLLLRCDENEFHRIANRRAA